MRTVVCVLGGICAAGAVLLAGLCILPAAGMLAFWALILLGGLAIERWRYKRLASRPSGPDWQMTGERFVDPESGKTITVYFNSTTGERRYVAG